MEDEKIVDLYLDRNEDAIRLTKEKYGPRLRRMAEDILADREQALECENDAYLEIWNLIPPHEPGTYLFAFAGRILRHLALDRCRIRRRQKRSGEICLLTEEMQECIPGRGEGLDRGRSRPCRGGRPDPCHRRAGRRGQSGRSTADPGKVGMPCPG